MIDLRKLAQFQSVCPESKIVITGTTALYLQGFDVTPHDLDIVIDSPKLFKFFKIFELKKRKYYSSMFEGKRIVADLPDLGEVDVWLQPDHNKNLYPSDVDGIFVERASDIFKTKKKMARKKDYEFFLSLMK